MRDGGNDRDSASMWMRRLRRGEERVETFGVEGPPGLVACGAAAGIVAGVALGAMVGPVGVAVGVGLGSLVGYGVGVAMTASERRNLAARARAESTHADALTPPPPAYG